MPVERSAFLDTGLYAATCEYLRNGNLLCGTYQLTPAELPSSDQCEKRLGSLLVVDTTETGSLKVQQSVVMPGILDIKPHPSSDLVAIMLADGSVRFFAEKKSPLDNSISLLEGQTVPVTEGLCLAGSWSMISDVTSLAVSDSCGGISVLKAGESGYSVAESCSRKVHDYEVWSVCWDVENNDVLYTGGDDSLLKVTDFRTPGKATIVRGHGAGVTSIVCDPSFGHAILTGSYDENIRFWDKRSLKEPVSALNLGGGVWRIKVNPGIPSNLLACACMQGGCRIIQVCNQEFQVLEDFMHDRQLVYGLDWAPLMHNQTGLPTTNSQFELAACSFYDHVLDLYELRLPFGKV